ncbi:MAG: 6-phosphogluconolactonase [Erythrobacter sp.]
MDNTIVLAQAADSTIADWIAPRLGAALEASTGAVAIALPGGSTPFPILARLIKHDLDWQRVAIYPTDDRLVPEDHPASNTGKLRSLLEPAGATVESLKIDAALPHFALVWLGMGADGHIASLFPNTDPRADDPEAVRRLTPDPLPPEAPFDRITLTIPALVGCDDMLLVIRGEDKRAVLDAALAGEHDLPIARLLAARRPRGPVTCFT